ncbi:UNVERIFIED_ORG: protoheme ferro-lyase [Pseudomonas cremoricolorata]|nr:protoheme ferro-lyase [Pseudomonas cremoricolorata]
MASVTYLRSIANNTPYTLTLVDGESRSQSLAIGAQHAWNGSLAVPWIGKSKENYKALRLILGPGAETNIWVFQDYWQPAHKDVVKYLTASSMEYTSEEVMEVPGDNHESGSKNLIVSLVNRQFKLFMA